MVRFSRASSLLPVIILYNYQGSQKGFEDSYREDFTSQENKFLESHRRSKSYGNFQFGSLEGSYEIDTLNLIVFYESDDWQFYE